MDSARYNFVILVLFVTDVSLAAATTCPYLDKKCDCTRKSVTCKNMQQMPQLVNESDVTVVSEAIFYGGNITSILNNSLPSALVKITFMDNPLTDISDDAFQDSATTLDVMSITNATFNSLPNAFLQLTNLTSLSIADTYIEDWNGETLQHIGTSLRQLELRNVGLSVWPSWFSFFHFLSKVDLSQNSIGSIPDEAFISSTDTLTSLNLQNCNLSEVPQALSTLTNLTSLFLAGNNMTDIKGIPVIEQLALFPCAKTLLILDIESMGLTAVPSLSSFTHLSSVYLGYNQLSDSSNGSFPLSVGTLELQWNNLTSVPAAIANISNLWSLILKNNQITEINIDMFPSSLIYLDLSKNKITQITSRISSNYSNLQELSLKSNPISIISPLAFIGLVSLRTLDLQGTNMAQIPFALTSLTRISTLDMSRIPSLFCPYPLRTELISWYKSFMFGLDIKGQCSTGRELNEYFYYSSHIQGSATQETQPPASQGTQLSTNQSTTSTSADATIPVYSLRCLTCFLVLFAERLYYL